GVAGDFDDFHAVAQGGWHGVQVVGGGDKDDLGEVEGYVEVVVHEGVVLAGVEHFEQGAGGVPAEVGADLGDFVEHQGGVAGAGPPQFLDDASGHGADIRAAMSADFGFVVHAAEAEADEPAAEGV